MNRPMDSRPRPFRRKRRQATFLWIIVLVGLAFGLALIALAVVLTVKLWPSGRGQGSLASRPTPPGWQNVVSTEGRFRVFMQGNPKIQDDFVHTRLGSLRVTAYDIDSGDCSFSVFYGDLDSSGLQKVSPEQWIDAVRDIYIERAKATLLEEKILSLQSQFGKETRYKVQTVGKVTRRMFADKRRIYTVNFAEKKQGSHEDVLTRFFDSFEILP